MYCNFTAHKPSQNGTSSRNIFDYLNKENQAEQEKDILSWKSGAISLEEMETNFYHYDNLFNQDFDIEKLDDEKNHISVETASRMIDENRGTQRKTEANFYMMNISPSAQELAHLEKQAEQILAERGLRKFDLEKTKDPLVIEYYNEQKEQVLKAQLKSYAQDIMNEYARAMNREVYVHQDKLPDDKARREMLPEIERRYEEYLKEQGISTTQELPLTTEISYRDMKTLEKGAMFSIYDENRNINYNLYVPENKILKAENGKLQLYEEYFSDKYRQVIDQSNYNNEYINIQQKATNIVETKETFTDFYREEKIVISDKYVNKEFNEDLKLYFSKSECEFSAGKYLIKEEVYQRKLHQAQSNFLNKAFADKRQEIFNELASKKGYDFTKIPNEKGKMVYKNLEKVPNGQNFKNFNTEVSVSFNKFLEENGYLSKREERANIQDWQTTTEIKAEALLETDKAVLLKIEDERLEKPLQMWVGKFAIKSEYVIGESQQLSVLKDFYEPLVKNELKIQNSGTLEFSEYSEISSVQQTNVKGKENIAFTYEHEKLANPFTFHIEKEKLNIVDGQYSMSRSDFEIRYNAHLIEHCKQELKSDYENISNRISQEYSGERQQIIDRETEKEFKNFLIDKGILQKERDDNYIVKGEITEAKENSSMVALQVKEYEESIKLWVNNKDFSINKQGEISFKNEEQAKILIEKAIERDKEQKTKVEITFDKVEVSDIKVKEGQEPDKMYTFSKKEQGLKEPIKFTFKESELHREGEKIFVEKYKLDHRTEKAVENQTKNEYGEVREKIKDQVWSENGYDTTKRKLEGKDLMWFGKIETERSYSHKDKQVLENRETLKQIKELKEQPKPNQKEIERLEKSLHRDKVSNEVIKEGVKKSGNQTHIHIVVSRHDKTSLNPKDKVSMSPLANHKEGTLHNGAKVGFNRDEFFKNQEAIFDKKFGYSRNVEHSYQYQNMLKNEVKGQIKGQVKGKVKQFVQEHTGLSKMRQELNPTNEFRKEFKDIPLPTRFPKTKLEAVKKVVMQVKKMVMDTGQNISY